MYFVDLNSDLGESFGNYTIGMDEEILKYVSSAKCSLRMACRRCHGDGKDCCPGKAVWHSSGSPSGISGPDGIRPQEHGSDSRGGQGHCEGKGGFLRSKWCGSLECELAMKERAGVSSRCMPLEQSGTEASAPCAARSAPPTSTGAWPTNPAPPDQHRERKEGRREGSRGGFRVFYAKRERSFFAQQPLPTEKSFAYRHKNRLFFLLFSEYNEGEGR